MQNQFKTLITISVAAFLFSCSKKSETYNSKSPDGNVVVNFTNNEGKALYNVLYKGDTLLRNSALGFELKNAEPLTGNFEIAETKASTFNETWKPIWGERSSIVNNYNELIVKLKETTGKHRLLIVVFRVYNDGLGFRYEFPEQPDLKEFAITNERTEFSLVGDPFAWWIPANYVSDEELYNATPLSQADSMIKNSTYKGSNELYMENVATVNTAFNTPLTMRTEKGTYLSFHEADQFDYSDMTLGLKSENGKLKLTSELIPSRDSATVKATAPFKTPWRTIQIADKPGDLMVSDLILNLNEPSQFKDDTAWCKPLKYIGIWWGYHSGKWSWEPGDLKREHGANTVNAKIYIDFAAKHHMKGLLIEGWNPALTDTSFARTFSKSSGDYPMGLRDYTKGHPDFDLIEVARYAREKGIELMLLDETMGAVRNFEAQMEKAFKLYDSLGIHYIKAGHAWYIENKEHFHKDQWKIQYDMRVLQAASKYHINVIAHESNKDTGLRRRFPNYQSREAVRGNEYNAWDKAMGNPPEHETIIPFTRGLAGPIDYTPGIFDLTFDKYKGPQRVNTTKAKQLSLYVVLYSPIAMAADLIENYENDPAFKFIEDVPVTWDETKVLNAEISEYVTVARRSGNDWYLGSLTDENARELNVPLTFLDEGKKYKAEIYADSPKTDLKTNPGAVEITQMDVNKNTVLKVKMAQSGGVAVRIVPTQ